MKSMVSQRTLFCSESHVAATCACNRFSRPRSSIKRQRSTLVNFPRGNGMPVVMGHATERVANGSSMTRSTRVAANADSPAAMVPSNTAARTTRGAARFGTIPSSSRTESRRLIAAIVQCLAGCLKHDAASISQLENLTLSPRPRPSDNSPAWHRLVDSLCSPHGNSHGGPIVERPPEDRWRWSRCRLMSTTGRLNARRSAAGVDDDY